MLVLARRKKESIEIDGRIRMTVLAIKNGLVRIGIDAPDEVPVLCGELDTETAREDGTGRRTVTVDEMTVYRQCVVTPFDTIRLRNPVIGVQ